MIEQNEMANVWPQICLELQNYLEKRRAGQKLGIDGAILDVALQRINQQGRSFWDRPSNSFRIGADDQMVINDRYARIFGLYCKSHIIQLATEEAKERLMILAKSSLAQCIDLKAALRLFINQLYTHFLLRFSDCERPDPLWLFVADNIPAHKLGLNDIIRYFQSQTLVLDTNAKVNQLDTPFNFASICLHTVLTTALHKISEQRQIVLADLYEADKIWQLILTGNDLAELTNSVFQLISKKRLQEIKNEFELWGKISQNWPQITKRIVKLCRKIFPDIRRIAELPNPGININPQKKQIQNPNLYDFFSALEKNTMTYNHPFFKSYFLVRNSDKISLKLFNFNKKNLPSKKGQKKLLVEEIIFTIDANRLKIKLYLRNIVYYPSTQYISRPKTAEIII